MKKYIIATIGSHSALQILKGAKDEGFKTLLFTTKEREDFYRRFSFIDNIKTFSTYDELSKFKNKNIIIIPHGSFIKNHLPLPYFGNKKVLDFEADRNLQYKWLSQAKLNLPKQYQLTDKGINFPIIIKSHGAAGGKGYFIANNYQEMSEKLSKFSSEYIIQEYIVGVTFYFHYFYSNLTNKLEIMSMDRRYETNIDGLSRMPINVDPSFVVVGNSPLVLRESLLPEVMDMGERTVNVSKKVISPDGLYGPFCLETIITQDQKIYVIEISARIVAGTNLYINGSPYSWLNYNEPMSTGRRVAREIKLAIKNNKLDLII